MRGEVAVGGTETEDGGFDVAEAGEGYFCYLGGVSWHDIL